MKWDFFSKLFKRKQHTDNIDKIENALDMDSGYLVYIPYRASEILAKQAYKLAGGEPFSNEHYIENYFNVATFEETDDLDSLIKQLKGLGVRKHYSDIMFSL